MLSILWYFPFHVVSNESFIISCVAVSEYVKNVEGCPGLEDRLSQHNTTYELESGGREPLFPPHLTPIQIHGGIKAGNLFQGSFLASRENFLEGTVNVEGQEKMVGILMYFLV